MKNFKFSRELFILISNHFFIFKQLFYFTLSSSEPTYNSGSSYIPITKEFLFFFFSVLVIFLN
jgi:hypothetical protein